MGITSKAQTTKTKIDRWDYIKIKNCAVKKTINRLKKQTKNWRKYLKNMYLLKG